NHIQQHETNLLEAKEADVGFWKQYFNAVFILLTVTIIVILVLVFAAIYFNLNARQKAEKDLVKSKEMLQAILDNTTSIIFVKDLKGRFIVGNQQLLQIMGVKHESELIGKTVYDFFPAEIADTFTKIDQEVMLANKLIEAEEYAPFSDGVHTYISIKFPLHDDEGNVIGIGAVSTDITERKNAEIQLKEAFNNINDLYNNAPCGYHSLNADGQFVSINKTEADWLGYKP